MKYTLFFLGLAIGLLCPNHSTDAQIINFGVSPPLVQLKMQCNAQKTISLQLSNNSQYTLKLTARVMDLALSPAGDPQPLETVNAQWSCQNWISLKRAQVELAPNERQEFCVTIKSPANVQGGRYAVIVFETGDPQQHEKQVEFISRLGCIVMVELFGPKKIAGIISEFKQIPGTNKVLFISEVKNQGNIHFKLSGSILILTPENRIVDRLPLDVGTGTLLPGGKRVMETVWQNSRKMIPGSYRARLQVLIPGSKKVLQQAISFQIK